jgi:hypothetical protein
VPVRAVRLALYRQDGDRYYEAETLSQVGDVFHDAGDRESAERIWRQALTILDELDHASAGQLRARLMESPTRSVRNLPAQESARHP